MHNSLIAVGLLTLGTALVLVLPTPSWGRSFANYVVLHSLLESIAIVVSAMVFAVGWKTYNREAQANVVLLSCGFLCVSLLDFSHMLSFPSMPAYFTPSSLDKAIDFWLAARVLAAVVLAAVVFVPTQSTVTNATRYVLLGTMLVMTAVVHWVFLFHPDATPITYLPGYGLTAFKIGYEYTIVALNMFAAFTVWRRLSMPQPYNTQMMFVALCAMALSEILFSSFNDETDIYNFLGHVLKVVGYLCLYRAVFIETIERPYKLLESVMTQVRTSEIMLRATMNALAANICVLDEAGNILAVNNDWSDFAVLNGASPDNVCVGRNYLEVCAAATGEERATASAIADGIRDVTLGKRVSFEIEYPCHSPEEQRWFTASVRRFQLNDTVRTVVAHTDITQRKKAEIELHVSEERMRLMMQSVKDYAIIMLDPQGRVLTWNEGAQTITGYAMQEIIGQPVEFLYPAKDRASGLLNVLLKRARERGNVKRISWRVRKDGSRFIADTLITAIRDEKGILIGFASITHDITERKTNEHKIRKLNADLEVRIAQRTRDLETANTRLRESEEAIRAVVDNMTDCVITIDAYGIVQSANPAVERVLGYSPADIIGHNVSIIMPELHRSELYTFLERYARTGEMHMIGIEREIEGLNKNGHLIPLELSISEYLVQAKPFFTGILRDISERKRLFTQLTSAREEAERANQAKSTFLATMSHEIRTPMNAVTGLLELLSLTPMDDSQRTTLRVVRESGKSLMRIIDDILDFSKIEANKLGIHPEATRIGNLLEDVRNTYTSNASSKGLPIYCRVDDKISPALMVDSDRLRQILNNFVSNAIKFTSSGQIDITADLIEQSADANRVRFCVKDTGIGVSEEHQKHLFQPFAQAEYNTARRYGGTGLGLAISSRLVDLMGGSIDMVSELGKGCTMVLELSMPIADPALIMTGANSISSQYQPLLGAESRRAVPTVAQAEVDGTLVLLVDDHPVNRMLQMRQLNLLGYAAESAENGLQALESWKTGRFSLVLTDCNMPEMDGYELARSIRSLESLRTGTRCPIIACTANAMGGEAAMCLKAGMDDYIVKPVDLNSLLAKLERWLPLPAAPMLAPAGHRAATAGATSPLDHTMLADITSGDAAMERELLIVFQRANDEDAQHLAKAVSDRNSEQVKRLAHLIKGASAMIGATHLSSICERIEHANKSSDWNTVLTCLTEFQQEVVKLNHYFEELADRAIVT